MDAAELRPLRIGEILDVAIKIYRENFATLIKAVALVVAPVQVLVAVVQASAPDSPVRTPPPGSTAPPEIEFDQFWTYFAAFVIASILSALATQVATAASLKAVSGAYMGEKAEWRGSLRFALARLGSLAWLGLLTGVLLTLGLLVCIVPGVYLYGAWAVVVPVLLLEDVRGRRALTRSRSLVRDRWWPTFAAIVLGAVLVFALQAAFGVLLGLIFFAGGDSGVVQLVASAVLGTVSGVLATPFSAALVTVVYFDLRVRKEGLDLELLARRMGMEESGGARPTLVPPPASPPSGWPTPPEQSPPGWTPPPDGAPRA
ncbi:MAG: hypothetical protein M3N28_03280 [Actinomycetota bacterium]|nr:hypothetical protein [Actinomycetota bacterium]